MNENDPKPAENSDLSELDARLAKARGQAQDPLTQEGPEKSEKGGALGLAFRVSVEIVSAVAIGVGIGWLLDDWLDTRPWLMLVFIVLGFSAGILNVYRMASGFGYAPGYAKPDKNTGTNTSTNSGTKAGTDE